MNPMEALIAIETAAREGTPIPEPAASWYAARLKAWIMEGLTLDEAFGFADPKDRPASDNAARIRKIVTRKIYFLVTDYGDDAVQWDSVAEAAGVSVGTAKRYYYEVKERMHDMVAFSQT
jgi:hypothetical protein